MVFESNTTATDWLRDWGSKKRLFYDTRDRLALSRLLTTTFTANGRVPTTDDCSRPTDCDPPTGELHGHRQTTAKPLLWDRELSGAACLT